MKKWLKIAGAVVVVLVVIALALPLFLSANTFKPMLERQLTAALGRKVAIGNISLSILSGSVSVDSFSVADDAAFSPSPFLTAERLSAGVALGPLIFSRQLDITSLTITAPHIRLLRSSSGRWNYSSLGAGAAAATSSSAPGTAPANPFRVGKLRLNGGSISIGEAGSSRVRQYSGVNLEAENVAYGARFPFQLTASTPGGGAVKLDGQAGPVNPADASLTPFHLQLSIQNFDLAATGFVAPTAGLGGVLGFDGTLDSDGRQASSKGTLRAQKLRLAPNATAATVPVSVQYATTYELHSGAGQLTQGDVQVGKAAATLTGTYNLAGAVADLDLQMTGAGMPATDLQGMLPALGLSLPPNATLTSGALDAALTFRGPLDKLVIAGSLKLANSRLAGFNLGGKLGALAAFAGLHPGGSDTEIQMLSSAVHVDNTGTVLHNLVVTVPALGTLSGDATVSPAGQLDCRMTARLAANAVTNAIQQVASRAGQSKAGSLLSGALQALTGGHAAAAGSQGKSAGTLTIPFRITGTTAQPVFRPELGGGH